MKVYIILYEDGMSGTIIDVYKDEIKAREIANKKNGKGLRYGTYLVIEKELI